MAMCSLPGEATTIKLGSSATFEDRERPEVGPDGRPAAGPMAKTGATLASPASSAIPAQCLASLMDLFLASGSWVPSPASSSESEAAPFRAAFEANPDLEPALENPPLECEPKDGPLAKETESMRTQVSRVRLRCPRKCGAPGMCTPGQDMELAMEAEAASAALDASFICLRRLDAFFEDDLESASSSLDVAAADMAMPSPAIAVLFCTTDPKDSMALAGNALRAGRCSTKDFKWDMPTVDASSSPSLPFSFDPGAKA